MIVGANRTARVWDVTTGRELGRAPPQDPPHGTSGIVVALSRHRAEGLHAYLAASATAKTIRVWDAQTGKTLFELHGHTDWVESLAFSPDGHLLASADADGTARVWDMDSGETLLSLRGHKGIIWSADFAPSGEHLVTAGADGTVRIWSTWTGTPLRGNADWVLDATFDPTGRYVLTAGTDHQVRRFDLSRLDAGAQHLYVPPRSPVNSVAYSANDRWFVMASADGVVTVRRASDGRALKPFILGDQSAYPPVSVALGHQSRRGRFVTALDNGTVMVVDVRTARGTGCSAVARRRMTSQPPGSPSSRRKVDRDHRTGPRRADLGRAHASPPLSALRGLWRRLQSAIQSQQPLASHHQRRWHGAHLGRA